MPYTEVFGGTAIYPSDVSYLRIDLTEDVTLGWPLEAEPDSVPAARIIDIAPDAPALNVVLPPADQTGVGQTILFNNLGPDTVSVLDAGGGTVLSITAGAQWQIYLTDNSTPEGVWQVFRYGAATAQAQASALAGQGLVATGSTLAQRYPVVEFNSNFAAGTSNRAATFVWQGASGTLTLPSAASATTGWFANVRNAGSGDLVIDPTGAELINGAATLSLRPNDSATVVTNGVEWFTIGLGQDAVFAFDFTTIDLTGQSSPYVLAGAELNRIAYRFVGALTADMRIEVPPTIQQYWVSNQTTGSFVFSVATPSQVVPFTVNQGARSILYSDGANVTNADTAGIAFPIAITAGGTGATSASAARVNLGASALGDTIFTAAATSDVWTALGAAPQGTVDGGVF
jgi:hypothetical protein